MKSAEMQAERRSPGHFPAQPALGANKMSQSTYPLKLPGIGPSNCSTQVEGMSISI